MHHAKPRTTPEIGAVFVARLFVHGGVDIPVCPHCRTNHPLFAEPPKKSRTRIETFRHEPLTRRRCVASPDRTRKGRTQVVLVRRIEGGASEHQQRRPRKLARTGQNTEHFSHPGGWPTKPGTVLPRVVRHCATAYRHVGWIRSLMLLREAETCRQMRV